jgi:hypothetical protein
MKTATKSKVNLAAIAANLLRAKDAGKEAYAKVDELLSQLLEHASPGQAIPIGGGQVVEIVDNFSKHGQAVNKAWKPCGINRFDVKVSRATDLRIV